MHLSLQNLSTVQDKVNEIINKKQLKTEPKIIVVSKTFPLSKVMPLIESGHIHFGENKVQEAEDKWGEVKSNNSNLKLHMVGKLQTNKAKKALKLFEAGTFDLKKAPHKGITVVDFDQTVANTTEKVIVKYKDGTSEKINAILVFELELADNTKYFP